MKLQTLAISFKSYEAGGATCKIARNVVDLSRKALGEVGVYNEDTGELLACFEDGTARLTEGKRGIELSIGLDENNPAHQAAVEFAGKSKCGVRVDYDENATQSQRVGPYSIYTKLNIAQIVLTADRPDTTDLHFIMDGDTARKCRRKGRIVFA